MTNHVMLDLERMGTASDAPIIAIGAVAFNEQGVIAGADFYSQVSLHSAIAAGARIDTATVIWWMKQSDDARSKFFDNEAAPQLFDALTEFSEWFRTVNGRQLWGNGAASDNAILSNVYRSVNLPQPWKFWDNRCYRTIKSLYNFIPMERVGTHHNALDDAKSQAAHLVSIHQMVGVPLE